MVTTAILIINWNNGSDTIACLDSVLAFANTQVLLIDNASTDNSVADIEVHLANSKVDYRKVSVSALNDKSNADVKVLLVQSDENLGFAKGNNVLLRYAIQCTDAQYAWLLNNDAVAEEQSLRALEDKLNSDKTLAFAGSLIMDYYNRDQVQCCGVKYYKYFGVSKLILKDALWSRTDKRAIPYQDIDFQHGASFMVRLSMVDEIGLMDERYFLYFEEHDWQSVAEEKGYGNAVAIDSKVYHKGSVSTSNKKHLFFYYYNRSAILFARKHSSLFVLLSVLVLLTGITIVRTKLYFKSLWWGMKGMWEGLTKR